MQCLLCTVYTYMQYTVYRELGALEAVSLKIAREALPASATNDD